MPARNPRNIVVIGSGPAGLQAALTAAERGHTVTVIENAVESWNVLDGTFELPSDKSIVVIGGGIVGCETAEYLAENGNDVTILEALPTYANGLEYVNRLVLDTTFQKLNINVMVNAKITSVAKKKVCYEHEGENCERACDLVVVSTGQRPYVPKVVKDLQDHDIRVIKLGDAEKVGKIFQATAEGFHKAHDLF